MKWILITIAVILVLSVIVYYMAEMHREIDRLRIQFIDATMPENIRNAFYESNREDFPTSSLP